MQNETPWRVGQSVVINRSTVATVERVTPTGRAVVNDRIFNTDGSERAPEYSRARLEALTPEIEEEMALVVLGREVSSEAFKALDAAQKWLRNNLGPWARSIPEASDVDRAERAGRRRQWLTRSAPC